MKYSAKVKGFSIVVPDFIVEVDDGQVATPIPPVQPPITTNKSKPFRADSWPYQNIQALPIHANSQALVAEFSRQFKKTSDGGRAVYAPNIMLHEYSTPIFHVTTDIQKVPVKLPNGEIITIRIPSDAFAAPGTDGHMQVNDWIDKRLADFWQYNHAAKTAAWGGVIENFPASDGTFAPGRGARACGIAASIGVIKISDLEAGEIGETLLMSTMFTNNNPKFPANRADTGANPAELIQMGQRYRIKASYAIPATFPPILKMICAAHQKRGFFIGDTTGKNVNMAYIEDPRPYGKTFEQISAAYFGGKVAWELAMMYPLDQLEAVA